MSRDDRFDLEVHGQRVVFGTSRNDDVPSELDTLGMRRVLLVATRSAKAPADELTERLGPRISSRVAEVVQHVPESAADSATSAAARADADGIITLGGGSATGLGKAVAVPTGLPLVAIPTTYAGSEATSVYGVTGEHKQTGRDVCALPRVVVYDPSLTTGMPSRLTPTSRLNALAHCVEALYSRQANPVTSLLSEEAIRLLVRALPAAQHSPDDLGSRGEALLGAYLAGWSMEQAGTALHHTLCHTIGGTYPVDHSDVHAVLLPYVAAYNTTEARDALAAVARALAGAEAAHSLRRLAERL